MPVDSKGNPFIFASKDGGFFHEVDFNNAKNDKYTTWSQTSFSGGVGTMKPNGPTSNDIGKNLSGFNDSIGGCGMDFADTAQRGYAYKKDDVRDAEITLWVKFDLPSGNGFSLSGPTGHHTGSGCCQGFSYMVTVEPSDSPSTSRFRKEIWHVQYDDTPKNSTKSMGIGNINGNGKYVGIKYIRYNTPGNEDNSVTLEVWANPDPEADPKNWKQVNKVVDSKGSGWSNGGSKCNGDKDQVGTWSNAKWRIKTNATSGTVRFKCWSIREIDPSKGFDNDPTPPSDGGGSGGGNPPSTQPPSITTFESTLKLGWSINMNDGLGCGPGGGGGGGLIKVYERSANKDKELSDSSTFSNRKRVAQNILSSGSSLAGKIPKQVDIPLKKVGTPGASPVINAKIWHGNTVKYTSPTNIDPTTLTTSYTTQTFDFSTNTYVLQVGDFIGVEWTGTSSTNYIKCSYTTGIPGNSDESQYEGTAWDNHSDRDFVMTVWK